MEFIVDLKIIKNQGWTEVVDADANCNLKPYIREKLKPIQNVELLDCISYGMYYIDCRIFIDADYSDLVNVLQLLREDFVLDYIRER